MRLLATLGLLEQVRAHASPPFGIYFYSPRGVPLIKVNAFQTPNGFANRNGLAYRDSSPRMQRVSNGHQTVAFQIQRPLTNGRLWTEMQVSAVGNEAVLITFAEPIDKGIRAESERGRAEVIAELRKRWPETAQVALQADGGLPREWRRQVRFE